MSATLDIQPFVTISHSPQALVQSNDYCLANGYVIQMPDVEEFNAEYLPKGAVMYEKFENDTCNLFSLPNWLSFYVRLNAEMLDVSCCEVVNGHVLINRLDGVLERSFELVTKENHRIKILVQRFLSLDQPELAAIKFKITSLNFEGKISFNPVIDGNDYPTAEVVEPLWNVLQSKTQKEVAHLWIQMRKSNVQVCQAMAFEFAKNNAFVKTNPTKIEKQKVAGFSFGADLKVGETVCAHKYVVQLNSLQHPYKELTERACEKALEAKQGGWDHVFAQNKMAWLQFWEKEGYQPTANQLLTREQIAEKFNKSFKR